MRKVKDITLDDRGTAKTFRITEMGASRFEWWLVSVGRLLAGTGLAGKLDVGAITDGGEAQEAIAGAVAKLLLTDGLTSLGRLDLDAVKPLYDELLKCCALKSGEYYAPLDPATVDAQIEDVRTLFTLRKEALMLHLSFLGLGSRLTSETAAATQSDTQKRRISVER